MNEKKNIQIYNIESIAKKMETEYNDVTSAIEHMATRGTSREEVLKKHLSELIPRRYEIGTGIIQDIECTQSKQQDLFIYDAFNSPVFLKSETSVVVPVESVYATIEVKSLLSKETMKQSIDNIRSVKSLKQTQLINSIWVPDYHNYIFGSIFAYTTDTSMDTLHRNIIEYCDNIPPSEWPSIICVFDKGVFINVKKSNVRQFVTMPSDDTMWIQMVNDRDVNLYIFYLVLQQHLNYTTNFPPDLLKYAVASHKLDGVSPTIRSDLIPDDMTMEIGEATLNSTELKKMSEATKKINGLLKSESEAEEMQDVRLTNDKIEEIIEELEPIIKKTLGVDRLITVNNQSSNNN